MGDRRIPVCPGDKAVRVLDRHEQRVLVQPVRLLEAESVEGTAGRWRPESVEAFQRPHPQRLSVRDDAAVVDGLDRAHTRVVDIGD